MFTLNATDPCNSKTPIRATIEDTLVVASFSAVSGLIAAGTINVQVITGTLLAAGLAAIITYARLRNIPLGK
jgi:hypothetical protein